jgi:hypothetical protein
MNTTKESPRGTSRKTAIIVGVLYIIGTVAGILSLTFTGPIRKAQDHLVYVSANENQAVMGALFVLIMGLALAMIPITLFPILRKHNEILALGYVIFRSGLEAFTYITIVISWLLLVPLSQAYTQAGASNPSSFQALGILLLDSGEISSVTAIVFPLGTLMFYTLLYRSKLIPRWLSGWGLVAIIPYFAAGLSAMLGIIDPLSSVGVVSDIPLALQEMVLAVWLIVKGFNSSPVNFGLAKVAIGQA